MTKNVLINAMDDEIIDNLVKHILSLNVDLKSRRYDEEIQTDDVKEQWLKRTLKNDPALFLEKWGKHLRPSDLDYFDPLNDDYEIAFHLRALKKNKPTTNSQTSNNNPEDRNKIIRNRRYNYVQQHPEYFTMENLQERNPYEYEEYIGQYIPEDKRVEFQPFQNNMSLVERMYFDIDHQRMNDEIEEMEDILYQEEEKEKEEEKRDEELFRKKEKEKNKNEVNKESEEEEEKEEKDNNENSTTNDSLMMDDNDNPVDRNKIKEDEEKAVEQSLETSLKNIDINEEDILKLTDKNSKFYQAMNALEDEDDFVEEEDDSDEEYNEETIMKEIERRRELKRKEQELKEKEREIISSQFTTSNDTKGRRTKIRIANPAYFDKKLENNNENENKGKRTESHGNSSDTNENENKKNTRETVSAEPPKPKKQSIEDIFNVKEEEEKEEENNGKKNNMEIHSEGNNNYNNNGEEEEEDEEISEELKQYYYNEFINIMKKEFIDGHDKTFDYSLVDDCEEYDDIQMYEQDMN